MKKLIIFLFLFSIFSAAGAQNQLKTIGSVNSYNPVTGRAMYIGDSVMLKGVVYGSFCAPARGPGPATILFSVTDSTGSIIAQWPRGFGSGGAYKGNYLPANGDSVMIKGIVAQAVGRPPLAQYSGTITLNLTDTVSFISNVYPRKVSKVARLSEERQAQYVELDSLELVNSTQWVSGSRAGFVVQAKRGNNQYTLYVNPNTTLVQSNAPVNAIFNIKGIEFQNDTSAPYLSNYFLMPTDSQDMTIILQKPIPWKKIADVKSYNANGIADSIGLYCFLTGVVEDSNLLSRGLLLSIRDSTGAITLVSNSNFGYASRIGDSLVVLGTIEQSQYGVTEMNIDSISILNSGHIVIPHPTAALDEATESDLVKISKVALTNPSQWDTTSFNPKNPKAYIEVQVGNSNGLYNLLILRTTNTFYHAAPAAGDSFNITGIGFQSDTVTPPPPFTFLSKYLLLPRMWSDFQFTPAIHTDFSADTVCGGASTKFTNLTKISDDNIVSQVWSFGDSTTSTDVDPMHNYSKSGSYTVKLKNTTGSGLIDSATHTVLVNPMANSSFTWKTVSGNTIQFTAQDSTNKSYNWDFGDGSLSNYMNKEYTYSNSGTYTASLTVVSKYGCTSTTSASVATGQSGAGIEKSVLDNLNINIAPNPFSASTVISYELTDNEYISAGVYDITGREIVELANNMQPKGKYAFSFDAARFSAGIYFLRMNISGSPLNLKIVKIN